MKTDAQTLKAHALYFARFVEEYAKEGIKIEAIHLQNEPGYGRVKGWTRLALRQLRQDLHGAHLRRAEHHRRDLVRDHVEGSGRHQHRAGDGKGRGRHEDRQGLRRAVEPVCGGRHLVASRRPSCRRSTAAATTTSQRPYWDQSRYSSSKAQNDHLYGEESWQGIRDWIVAGVNSYNAWNMVLDTVGKSLDNWPQNAPLVVDRTAKTLTRTAAYYVFRHFSATIAPGATRIGVTSSGDAYKGASSSNWNGVNAFAFKNPDGTVIVQVYNKAASAKQTTVGVGSALSQTLYQFDVPAHGWATVRIPQ